MTNTFDASAHSLGSRTVPIFVHSSQAIDGNPSQSNCRMLKLDYPSMRICNANVSLSLIFKFPILTCMNKNKSQPM